MWESFFIIFNKEKQSIHIWLLLQIIVGGGYKYLDYNGLKTFAKLINDKFIDTLSKIPTNNNQLDNGRGYITASALNGYATQDWVSGGYLSKSGGTLTNNTTNTFLTLNNTQTSPSEVGIKFSFNSNGRGWIGYNEGNGTYLYTYDGPHHMGIRKDGTGHIDGKTILHSDNYTNYTVPKTGGTFSGNVTAPTFIGNLQGNAEIATISRGLARKTSEITTQEEFDSFLFADRLTLTQFRGGSSYGGWDNSGVKGGDGMLISVPWTNTNYGAQLAFDDERPYMALRAKNNGTWTGWEQIAFTSSNVASATTSNTAKYFSRTVNISHDGTTGKYKKFARINVSAGAYTLSEGILNIYSAQSSGRLHFAFRTQASIASVSIVLNWEALSSKSFDRWVYAVKIEDGIYDLYIKSIDAWNNDTIELISQFDNIELVANQSWVDSITSVAVSSNTSVSAKLQTARTLWGQSFDGTGNVNGTAKINGSNADLYWMCESPNAKIAFGIGSGNINRGIYDFTNSDWWIYRDSTTNTYIKSSGNVGIGTISPTEKLEVSGNVKATTFKGNLEGTANTSKRLESRVRGNIDLNGTVTDKVTYGAEGIYIDRFSGGSTNYPGSSINNANNLITVSSGDHGSSGGIYGFQLCNTANTGLYYRNITAGSVTTNGWNKFAFVDQIPSILTQLNHDAYKAFSAYTYDSTNGTRHYSYKIYDFNAHGKISREFEIVNYNDINYPSSGRWILKLNYSQDYKPCVSLVQVQGNITQQSGDVFVYIDSNDYVWVQSRVVWDSAMYIRPIFSKYHQDVDLSGSERVIGTPENVVATIHNIGAWRKDFSPAIRVQQSFDMINAVDVAATTFKGNLQGNANSATKLKNECFIWGLKFDGSNTYNYGNLCLAASNTSHNSNSAILRFNGAYGDSVQGPSIRAISTNHYARHKLSIFQHDADDYTTESEVFNIMPNGDVNMVGNLYIGKNAGDSQSKIIFGDWNTNTGSPYTYIHENDDDCLKIHAQNQVSLSNRHGEIRFTDIEYIDEESAGDDAYFYPSVDSIHLGMTNHRFGGAYFSNAVHAAGGFYESSDERLKTFGSTLNIDLEELSKVRKSHFVFNDKPEKDHIGVSAQEIQRLYPEVVTETSDGYLNVDYAKLSVIALAAIDKLYEEIKELKSKI